MKKTSNKKQKKKVLNGINLNKKNKLEKSNYDTNMKNNYISNNNINDKIQSIVSILFTIVIFILILFLIFVIYNKFLKKKEEINKSEICKEYIKKDYNIKQDDINNYIRDNRYILYNINEFDNSNISKDTINEFSRYIIWNSDSEYSICNEYDYCLDTKKEMDYNTLKEKLLYYFNLESLNLIFDYSNFNENDVTRLFIESDKVILTFKGMEYITLKHDIVDTRIDEDRIYIIFSLSKKINDNIFSYTGYKNLELQYKDNNFIIKSIKTHIN